nr:hypothetical protein [bacterium]
MDQPPSRLNRVLFAVMDALQDEQKPQSDPQPYKAAAGLLSFFIMAVSFIMAFPGAMRDVQMSAKNNCVYSIMQAEKLSIDYNFRFERHAWTGPDGAG